MRHLDLPGSGAVRAGPGCKVLRLASDRDQIIWVSRRMSTSDKGKPGDKWD